jgi:2-C-methyl-D-erythritol 4-phosphate cytidylyltransferase
MKTVALVVAGGRGTRMGGGIPKQFLRLGKLPVLVHALLVFQRSRRISQIVLVVPKGFGGRAKALVGRHRLGKVVRVVMGGKERQDSVLLGLRAISQDADIVLIHDAARPGVTRNLVEGSIRRFLGKRDGVVVAVPVADTLKRVEKGMVIATLDRSVLWRAQTPQVFSYPAILEAYERAEREDFRATDDAAIYQWAGGRVSIFPGEARNLKVTTPEDLKMASFMLSKGKRI